MTTFSDQEKWLIKAISTVLTGDSRCRLTLLRLRKPKQWVEFWVLIIFQSIAMTKQDLINSMADASGITKRAAADALDALISTVTKQLKKGESVTVTGFGTFKVSDRKARTGVNPRNPSQRISIPAMKVPSFKAGKTLKDAVR